MAKKKGSAKKGIAAVPAAVADYEVCRACVKHTIEQVCQTTVDEVTDKLSDVCESCDTGTMANLEDALRRDCGAPQNLRLACSMTIIQVIHAVCRTR